MKIISKDQDFYDFAAGYSSDSSVVYERKPKTFRCRDELTRDEINCLMPHEYYTRGFGRKSKHDGVYRFVALIAGKVYPIYMTTTTSSGIPLPKHTKASKNPNDLFSKENQIEWETDSDWFAHWWDKKNFVPEGNDRFAYLNDRYDSPVIMFGCRDFYPIPHWIADKNTNQSASYSIAFDEFVVNPNLSRFGAGCIADGRQVYQEIYMWLSNRKEKEIVKLSNNERIVKAGHDLVTSFRGKSK